MTASEMATLIGREATWYARSAAGDLTFAVRIVDVRHGGWSRIHVLIEPVAGSGGSWVDLASVTVARI